VGNTANEINELGVDAETLSPSERRDRRLRYEESKWNPEHYMYVRAPESFPDRRVRRTPIPPAFCIRADFADNEQIEELIVWTHPHLESSSTTSVVFTEAENATMLRLPRKECTSYFSHRLTSPHFTSPFSSTTIYFSFKMTTLGHSNELFFLGHQKNK